MIEGRRTSWRNLDMMTSAAAATCALTTRPTALTLRLCEERWGPCGKKGGERESEGGSAWTNLGHVASKAMASRRTASRKHHGDPAPQAATLPTPPWTLFVTLTSDHGIPADDAWALANAASHLDHCEFDESVMHPGAVFLAALEHGDSPRTSWKEAMIYQGYEDHVAWDILRLRGQVSEDTEEEELFPTGRPKKRETVSRKRPLPSQGGRTTGKSSAAHTPTGSGSGTPRVRPLRELLRSVLSPRARCPERRERPRPRECRHHHPWSPPMSQRCTLSSSG